MKRFWILDFRFWIVWLAALAAVPAQAELTNVVRAFGGYPETNRVFGSNRFLFSRYGNSNAAVMAASLDTIMASINITAPNYLYVHTNGNDATAVKGNPLFAWRTLGAAETNAVPGDTIGAYPGVYLGTNLFRRSWINYWFEFGSELTNLSSASSHVLASSMFHDFGGPRTNAVGGYGTFRNTFDTNLNQTLLPLSAVVGLSNANSLVSFEGQDVHLRSFGLPTAGNVSAFYIINCRKFNGTVRNEIRDLDYGVASFNPQDPETEIYSNADGIYWKDGDCKFDVPWMVLEQGYGVYSAGATNRLDYRGVFLRTDTYPFYIAASSDNNTTWVEVNTVECFYTAIGGVPGTKGKFYGKFMKVRSGFPCITSGGQQMWIEMQKLTGIGPYGQYMALSGGDNTISILDYELEGNFAGPPSLGPGILITGGTNLISGGHLIMTNQVGVKLSGAHRTRFKDMIIEVANTGGNGDTNWCVMNETNGVTFQNVSLRAPTGVKAYWNSNAINVASVEGILFMNTTTNSEARFTNGIVASGGVTKFFP